MLDWEALIAKSPGQVGQAPEVSHPVPVESASVPPRVGQLKAFDSKACSRFFASVPVVPATKQRTDKEAEKTAGEAAGPQFFCAEVGEKANPLYEENPAAVLLLLAWARLKGADREERAALLLDLETLAPADQVKHWHGVCLRDGLKPWKVLYQPAALSGADCTRCKQLTTRHEAIDRGRLQYHWACSLGYLILEHGRGTERILLAPPECKDFERWHPSGWK